MTQVQTKFHKRNPFTGEPQTKRAEVDVDNITICEDPMPSGRKPKPGKYEQLFSDLEYGKRLNVPSGDVSRVCAALSHWVKKNSKPGIVRSCRFYDKDSEGLNRGGVWLIKE